MFLKVILLKVKTQVYIWQNSYENENQLNYLRYM